MPENIEIVSEWVETFREDVEALKKVISDEAVSEDARKYAAAALNYLISRMDLIPDWTETIGVVNDVMVLRTCVVLANQYGLHDDLHDADALVAVGRLANEADRIEAILGHDLEVKLRTFCARLADTAVRGRTPETIVTDAAARDKLFEEVDDDLKRLPPATFTDAEGVKAKLVSYLTAKLKDL